MHQVDTISDESAIVVLKSIDQTALTGIGPPSAFEDRRRDRTWRNGALKANLVQSDYFTDLVLGAQSIL